MSAENSKNMTQVIKINNQLIRYYTNDTFDKNLSIDEIEALKKRIKKFKTEMERIAQKYDVNINNYTDKEIEDFKKKVNWKDVSEYERLSLDFIRIFADNLDWWRVTGCQTHMPVDFLENYINKFGKNEWEHISSCYILSEEFIRKYEDKVDWYYISKWQNPFTLDFIREFQDRLDWYWISYQQFDEDFLREFEEKWDWDIISMYQKKLSRQFRQEYHNMPGWGHTHMAERC